MLAHNLGLYALCCIGLHTRVVNSHRSQSMHHFCGNVQIYLSSVADLQLGPVEETVSAGSWCRRCCWCFCSFLLFFGLLLPLLRKLLLGGGLGMYLCFGII